MVFGEEGEGGCANLCGIEWGILYAACGADMCSDIFHKNLLLDRKAHESINFEWAHLYLPKKCSFLFFEFLLALVEVILFSGFLLMRMTNRLWIGFLPF